MKRLSLLLATAVALLCSFASNAQVNHLVISQVYGGGGNSGATYKNDFVELFNPTTQTVTFTNWSVQYASNSGSSWSVATISGSIAPGGYFLIKLASNAAVGADLPTADATPTTALNLSGTAGKIALVSSTTPLSGTTLTSGSYVDMLGFGSSVTYFEGSGATPAPSNANSVSRKNNGCQDTDNNSADFTAGVASARNSSTPVNICPSVCTAPTNQPTVLSFTSDVFSISGSFNAAAAGTTAADNYLVLRSSSATLTSLPASGTAYTPGTTLGNATVVAAGNTTTFTSSSLAAGTTYYFFVFSYTATNCYNITSPLSSSIATNGAPTASIAAGVSASEPSTNGTFTITMTSAAPAGGITIAYTLGGTATAGTDYTDPQGGSINIPQGSTSGTITLTTQNDMVAEPAKTITITLSTITSPYQFGTATASINLTDDDVEPISFTGSYAQDFNTLATSSTSTTLPTGWTLNETGANANNTYAASDGSGGTFSGNTYSFGTGTNTDRAFGTVLSGNLTPTIGAIFTNNTGATLSSLNITYTGEQWRLGTSGRADRLDFKYSINATGLNNGTWTDVDALDFIAPISSGTVGGLDGNTAANRKLITYTLSGLSIPAGSNFVIRWTDFDASGAEDGLGVDDLTITLGCTAPTNQPTTLMLTPSLQSINGSFTAAAAGTMPADEYLVVMSTSSTLSMPPASGTVYAVDDEIGNGVVVASGSSTSFTVNSLTPGTTYYFFVYAASSATSCYNITSPLTANVATTTPPPCTSPTMQATGLSGINITGSSMDIGYTRGNGDNILVLARVASAVNANPTSGAGYTVGN